MPSICDLLDGWDSSDPNNYHDIGDFVNQTLDDWGFNPVNVVIGADPTFPESPGVYERDSDTLYLNPEVLDTNSSSAVDVALHEALHATADQLGWPADNFGEEQLAGFYGQAVGQDLRDKCKDLESGGLESDDDDDDEGDDPRPHLKYPWVTKAG